MKKETFLIIFAMILLSLAPTARADGISYTLTNLGGQNWSYTYTVTNTTIASGLYAFDIYFPAVSSADALSYSNITEIANPDSTNWITTIFDPSAPNLGGFYDALALASPINQGDSLGGFNVSFAYSGATPLGSQYFEIYDLNYNLLETGTTVPTPEPSTFLLFVSGVLVFLGLGRWSR